MNPTAVARQLGLVRSALRRTPDRVEIVVLWLALLAALVAVPAAAAIGVAADEHSRREAAVQAATTTRVVAHTLQAAPVQVAATVAISTQVDAIWTDTRGAVRTGRVAVPPGTRSGADVPVWIDRAGNQVGAPPGRATSMMTGVVAGLGSLAVALLGLGITVGGVRVGLDRWRLRGWRLDWERVSGTWCKC